MSLTCPELQGLRRVLAGPASADEVERLARHLEVCGECGQMMAQLLEEDTLVGALRQPTQVESDAESPVVQGLIARLQGLRRAAPARSSESDLEETRGGPATAEKPPLAAERPDVPRPQTGSPPAEGYDFLASAQGPGEIGRLGPYRVVKVLGRGGMGVVFLAEDVHLQRYVALKAIRPALVERERIRDRFLREARAMAAVRSDHVVTVHQVGEDRGVPFLAMELMEGETLQERLKRERQLPLAEVLRIGRETALGLEAAHRRGLIHRDVKPSNVWLEAGSGRVKILDFGLARASDDDTQLTGIGTVLGTPSYMPPEQAQSLPVDYRSDLFSLGCVLYQACTGQLPFQGKDVMSQLSALATASPAPPNQINADVPPAVSELIMRLLAKDRESRPESAGAVAEALAEAERELAAVTLRGSERIHAGESLRDSRPISERPDEMLVVPPSGGSDRLKPALRTPVSERPGYVSPLPAARRYIPRRWLIATAASGALILVAILAGQIIVRITNRDGQVTEVPVPPGAKVEIVETEKAPVRQAFQPDKPGSQAGKPDVPLADKAKPFVLLRNGTQAGEFKGLGGALAAIQAGDEIVVHGNGPFAMDTARLDVGLNLRAAPGYRPRFVVGKPEPNHSCLELRGPLRVEGCDFVSPEPVFVFGGGGGPCEFLACRAYTHMPLGSPFAGVLVSWGDAPSIRVRDCLLVNQEIRAEGAPEVELTNNIACLLAGQVLGAGEVRNVRLVHNTLIAGLGGGGCSVLNARIADNPQRLTTKVAAVGNIFLCTYLVSLQSSQGTQPKDCLVWEGRQNLYVNEFTFNFNFNVTTYGEKPSEGPGTDGAKDFAEWKKLWGGEEGSQFVDRLAFQPAQFSLGTPDEALNWIRQRTETIRQQLGAKAGDCGPQWDLIGPGEPYVRALAAAGKPVTQDQLRPEQSEGGPFVLIREDKAVRGYVKLQDAVDAVQDGDTIEIRTDGPIVGCNFGAPPGTAAVTLRAAPGYRPVLSSAVNSLRGEVRLTVEGLHFRNAPLRVEPPDKAGGGLARLANCSFEGEQTLCAAYWAADAGALEIHNCLIPRGLSTARRDTQDTTRLALTNSVLGGIGADLVQREVAVTLRQSIVESPGLLKGREAGWCLAYPIDMIAERTFFDSAGWLGADPKRCWKGTGNIYSVLVGRPLEDLRTGWKSPEERSLEADPFVLDPRSWQLLPSSPGDRQGPGGRDYGADVSRIAGALEANAKASDRPGEPPASASGRGSTTTRRPGR